MSGSSRNEAENEVIELINCRQKVSHTTLNITSVVAVPWAQVSRRRLLSPTTIRGKQRESNACVCGCSFDAYLSPLTHCLKVE